MVKHGSDIQGASNPRRTLQLGALETWPIAPLPSLSCCWPMRLDNRRPSRPPGPGTMRPRAPWCLGPPIGMAAGRPWASRDRGLAMIEPPGRRAHRAAARPEPPRDIGPRDGPSGELRDARMTPGSRRQASALGRATLLGRAPLYQPGNMLEKRVRPGRQYPPRAEATSRLGPLVPRPLEMKGD